jgi:hypothetical protein
MLGAQPLEMELQLVLNINKGMGVSIDTHGRDVSIDAYTSSLATGFMTSNTRTIC